MRTTALTIGRCVAAFISLGTFANLLVSDVDSAFVVPDILVGAALAAGAALPGERHAARSLTAAFGLAAGVFTVAVFAHIAKGGFGVGVLVYALICLAMTVLFSWRIGGRSPLPGGPTPT